MLLGNLLAKTPNASTEEKIELLLQTDAVRIERIVSKGQVSAENFWYDQKEDEFVLLLKGGAALQFEGEKQARFLAAGDYLLIPAHCRHRISWTSPKTETIWLAVFAKN